MQIQPISNNYQARTQKAQKQNTPSFGATIKFSKFEEISSLFGDFSMALEKTKLQEKTALLERARQLWFGIIDSVIANNNPKNPTSHLTFDESCTVRVRNISLQTPDNVVLASSSPSETSKTLMELTKIHPKRVSFVIETENGGKVTVPLTAPKEEITETGAKIQQAAIDQYRKKDPVAAKADCLVAINFDKPIKDVEL